MPLSQITPEDAVLIFRKWQSEALEVLCSGAFFGCSFNLVGHVTAASLDRVDFVGTGSGSNLCFWPTWEGLEFGYTEPKELPIDVPEHAKSSSALTVCLAFRLTIGEFDSGVVPRREKLLFLELRKPERNLEE